jgi:hypothetical protein
MSTDEHLKTYGRMTSAIKRAGMKGYALVAVDTKGEVFWGGDFRHQPEALLRHLRQIQHDIQQYMKSSSYRPTTS